MQREVVIGITRLQELARKLAQDPSSLTLNEEREFHRLMASKMNTKRAEEALRLWRDAML